MIDPNILKNLGWSDELIQQVTRVSEELREAVPYLPELSSSDLMTHALSSTTIEPVQSTNTDFSVYVIHRSH